MARWKAKISCMPLTRGGLKHSRLPRHSNDGEKLLCLCIDSKLSHQCPSWTRYGGNATVVTYNLGKADGPCAKVTRRDHSMNRKH
jgi:hypothetical protein